MKMEIEIPTGYKAEWVNGVLTLVQDKKENLRPVTERVKTFEDAVAELGEDNNLVMMFKHFEAEGFAAGSEDFIAYLKLRIITAALNEGWTPQFTGDEYRYSTWFDLYGEQEWNDLSEDTKRQRGVLFGGSANHGALAGFVCARSNAVPSDALAGFVCARSNAVSSDTLAYIGSRLCFKNRNLALYAGKQFASLWMDFCYLPNTKCKPYFNEQLSSDNTRLTQM